jgi:hypothetical protein
MCLYIGTYIVHAWVANIYIKDQFERGGNANIDTHSAPLIMKTSSAVDGIHVFNYSVEFALQFKNNVNFR